MFHRYEADHRTRVLPARDRRDRGLRVGAAATRARLRSPTCVTALDPPSRAISITAMMRPMAGTTKMQIKFDLTSRLNSSRSFTRVRGGDLNSWVTPKDPTLGERPDDVWNVIKQVVDLKAPATYRFKVFFRWIGAHSKVLGTAVKPARPAMSPSCAPTSRSRRSASRRSPAAPTRRVRRADPNNGATATGPFQVQFIDGAVEKTHSVADLEPHASITAALRGALVRDRDGQRHRRSGQSGRRSQPREQLAQRHLLGHGQQGPAAPRHVSR